MLVKAACVNYGGPASQLLLIHDFQKAWVEWEERKPLGKQRRELEPLRALWSVGRKWSCQLLYSCFTNLTHEQVSKSKQRFPQTPLNRHHINTASWTTWNVQLSPSRHQTLLPFPSTNVKQATQAGDGSFDSKDHTSLRDLEQPPKLSLFLSSNPMSGETLSPPSIRVTTAGPWHAVVASLYFLFPTFTMCTLSVHNCWEEMGLVQKEISVWQLNWGRGQLFTN